MARIGGVFVHADRACRYLGGVAPYLHAVLIVMLFIRS